MLFRRYWRQAGPVAIILLLLVELVVDTTYNVAPRLGGAAHVHLWLHLVQFVATVAIAVLAGRSVQHALSRQHRQSRHYASLTELGTSALQEEDPFKIYQRCATLLVDVLKCDAAIYLEINSAGTGWDISATAGRFASLLPMPQDVPWGPGCFGDYVLHSTAQPVHVGNFAAEKRFVMPEQLDLGFVSALAVRTQRLGAPHGLLVAMFRKPTACDSHRASYLRSVSVLLTRYLHAWEAARAQRRSDTLFHQMAEHIQEVFYVANADGSKVHYISPAYEQIWQASPAALYQNPRAWLDSIHEDDRAEAAKMLRDNARGRHYERTYRVVRADGSVRWIRDRSFPIVEKDGRVVRVAGIASDATDARAAQTIANELLLSHERTARAEAETHIRTRDEVLAIVSHDLRTPLSSIAMAAQRLNKHLQADAKAEALSGRIVQAADRMERLVQDLLEVSRLESGMLRLERHTMPLAELWQDATDAYAVDHEKVSVVFDPVGSVRAGLSVDAMRILQALGNLVSNAVRFTPAGGAVNVSVETHATGLRFCVRDAGPGIPQEQVTRLFEPFWQGSRADKGGLGLGLHIAKGIVEAHGGSIGAENRSPHGTLVWFALPIDRTHPASQPAHRSQAAEGQPPPVPPEAPRALPAAIQAPLPPPLPVDARLN